MLRATYSEVVRTVAARVNAVPARACPRPESTLACLPCLLALLAHSALVQPSPPVCSCSLSLSLSLSLLLLLARSASARAGAKPRRSRHAAPGVPQATLASIPQQDGRRERSRLEHGRSVRCASAVQVSPGQGGSIKLARTLVIRVVISRGDLRSRFQTCATHETARRGVTRGCNPPL
jgi:hypothetical protein